MYNYSNNPYGNRPPPGFPVGAFPGAPGGPPPNLGAPPGMSAPGTGPAPGMEQLNTQQPSRPGGLPPNFQPPANMPNINFSAPVIRLGTTGPAKGSTPVGASEAGRRDGDRSNKAGIGSQDPQRSGARENLVPMVPPSKDELARTIFVGGITEGARGDEGIEKILQCAGNLKRWTRAMDADDKACRFGFAEYEDPDSLATAIEILNDVEVPVKLQSPDESSKDDEQEIEKSTLLIVIDDSSKDYIEQYLQNKGDEDPVVHQLRLDNARKALSSVLQDLQHPSVEAQNPDLSRVDGEGDTSVDANGDAEVVTIPLTVDDELSDIPAEMRETVAKEITAFRDRSNKRDLERLKREEEIEAMERQRGNGPPRRSRLASPTAAPAGPAGGSNGVPSGPRDRAIPNAPSGPKGYQGQMPYQKGVFFVNGTGLHGAGGGWIDRDDEDTDASDDELERRRVAKKEAEQEKQYLDQERKWLNRERSRTAAVEREKNRDNAEDSKHNSEKETAARKLRELNDDVEAKKGSDDYYADRSLWLRNRSAFRAREANLDELDRAAEERERERETRQQSKAMGLADDFLSRQSIELDGKAQTQREPQRFKLSLGAAAQKAQQAASSRRTVAEVEGLLEDEEEGDSTAKRTLVPIKLDETAGAAGLSEEERSQAVRQLAAEIPSDKDGLWAWSVKWEFVDDNVVNDQLRPFVEKKIMEYLGVQEQMLVDAVEEHIRKRGSPGDLVESLEGALDEEAEVLVKKLWRMIIFFSESEKKGLST